jgi:V8-like Glu-specific endopeptidase
MRSPWQSLAIASLLAFVVGGVASAADGSPGHDRDAAKRPVSSPRTMTASEAETVAYWTPQRMANAVPVEAERGRPNPRVEDESSAMKRDGSSIAGVGVPNDQAGRVVMAAQVQPAAEYPFPFGRRSIETQLRKVAPYKTVGRVFYRQGGVNYVCSGSSVVSRPNNVVFTAGHCLNDGDGTWSKNVVFVPGWRPGKNHAPYGVFPAKTLWAPDGWVSQHLYAYDIGAFSVKKNAKKKTLQKTVGALGFAFNLGRVQHWDSFGYPVQSPFSGDRLTTCTSAFAVQDDMGGEGPDTNGVGCDMSGGSSGGPWILMLRRGNLLNGVTSYGYQNMPAARFSPYFDGAANNLRCAAAKEDADATSC